MKNLRPFLQICVLVFVAAQSALASAPFTQINQRDGITEHRLANGLRIVLAPDASAGRVHLHLVYRTGSLADPDDKGGTAHLLEHLMFKGTGQRTGEQLVGGLRERGIGFNATTSFDRTRYSAVLDTDHAKLDWLLALEAERMAGIRFEQTTLEAETSVVLREMEQAQDNPLAALGQRMMATASPGQGLGRHVLGTREELGRIDLDDLRRFHAAHYRPDNAVLVVTGGFDPAKVLASAAQHFTHLGSAQVQPDSAERDAALSIPSQPTVARLKRGNIDMLVLAYPLPPALDMRNVALSAVADIFAGEPHGRLYRTLVMPGKAQGVFAVQQGFGRGGFYLFGALLTPEQSMEVAQAALVEQLETVASNPITEAELLRVQNANQPTKARLLREPGALGELLSESAAQGDWQLMLERLERFGSLDIATVQQQAEAHLLPQRRLVGQLRAGASEATAPAVSPAVVQPPSSRATESALPAAEPVDLAAFNREAQDIERSVQRGHLDSGLRYALRPLPGSPRPVQGSMVLRFGTAEGLAGTQALSDLTGTVLIRGTRNQSFQQIVDRVNGWGARLAVVPGDGQVSVNFESPKEHLSEVLALVTDVLRRPAFLQAEFDLIKRQQLQGWSVEPDQPAQVASLRLGRHLERHPAGDVRRHREPAEMRAALAAIAREDVVRFHENFYGASQGELVITGDIDPQKVHGELNALLGDWRSASPYAHPEDAFHEAPAIRIHAKANAPQTGHYVGRLRFAVNAKTSEQDTAALFVAEHILGRHPLASRLGQRLRQEEGLVYDIRSSIRIPTFDNNGWVTVQGGYPLGQGERLADIVRQEITRLVEHGITPQELERAQRTILHERRLSLAQPDSAQNWLRRQLQDDTTMQTVVDRNNTFAAMTVEQVNAVLRRFFDVGTMVEVLADGHGNPEAARSTGS